MKRPQPLGSLPHRSTGRALGAWGAVAGFAGGVEDGSAASHAFRRPVGADGGYGRVTRLFALMVRDGEKAAEQGHGSAAGDGQDFQQAFFLHGGHAIPTFLSEIAP